MTNLTERGCDRIAGLLDFYLDRELPQAEMAEVARHLDECEACERELASRSELRDRIRAAARSTVAPADLAQRIRVRVGSAQRTNRWHGGLMAIAATVLLGVSGLIAYQLGHLRLTTASQDAYNASVAGEVASIMRVGLKDHVHCAVFRKYPSHPPTVDEMAGQLGPEFADLIDVVQEHVPQGLKVVMGHKCRYRGRQYVHLVARDGGNLVSLVIARRDQGEAFENDLRAVVSEAGVPIYAASVQRFNMAGFETKDHLVYLISDFDEQRNLKAMESMTAGIRKVLGKIEI